MSPSECILHPIYGQLEGPVESSPRHRRNLPGHILDFRYGRLARRVSGKLIYKILLREQHRG